MIVRVEIAAKPDTFDARGHEVVAEASQLGIVGLTHVEVRDLFFLAGDALDEDTVRRVVEKVLLDPVVATARWTVLAPHTAGTPQPGAGRVVEVAPLPGTTDSIAETLLGAMQDYGFGAVTQAATGTQYRIQGDLPQALLERLAAGVLANEVIESWVLDGSVVPPFVEGTQPDLTVETIALRVADDAGLLAISKERRLSLNLIEMRAIQASYLAEDRDPTDAELEMFAQTWSEHCVHKTFKARITLTEDGVTSVVDSLFKTYIKAATDLATTPWLKSVFVDNAGIVGFEDGWDVAFKAETHNHPSALEPFGGANTGVGGVIRDVLGVSARPIACTDTLCFGPGDLSFDALPHGVLHPRRIAHGVIEGIADYGNKMGIPTVNGAIRYDQGYTANPLVYAGCVGILPAGAHRAKAEIGDYVVTMGGRTGRDGLRGATFSSMEMDIETSTIAGSSVQIGHPIHEKQAMEALLVARDEGLYTAVTDCGAGGLSSAVGEMAAELGAHIHLERVPLKYSGLRPWEIWLSEAQERMVFAVSPANWPRFEAICVERGVEAVALGHFTGNGRLKLVYGDVVVADLSMHALHEGIPQLQLTAVWETPSLTEPELGPLDLGAELLGLLASPNIRSNESVVRGYDHEVQAGTIVKPFVGVRNDGPSDAAVLRPLDVVLATGKMGGRGVALSVGINPQYGKIDPYAMAWAVVDEAVRNVVAVGGDPDQVALLDNFCWGNPNLPDRLAGLVRASRGCFDAAVAWKAPYISGKDSLNNEYTGADGQKHAIPGTLLISALAMVPDVDATATMDFKAAGNAIYVVGTTANELGGSALYEAHGTLGANVPQHVDEAPALARALHKVIRAGGVRAVHDASEGGLLVSLAEMAIAGRTGADVDLGAATFRGEGRSDLSVAFAESLTRWVVEVAPDQIASFEAAFAGLPCARVGTVASGTDLVVRGVGGAPVAKVSVDALTQAWRGSLV